MADGIDERANVPVPRRRYGEAEYGKDYSDELDHSIGSTSLNARVRMNEDQQHPKTFTRKLRGKTGLIFKEPLY